MSRLLAGIIATGATMIIASACAGGNGAAARHFGFPPAAQIDMPDFGALGRQEARRNRITSPLLEASGPARHPGEKIP